MPDQAVVFDLDGTLLDSLRDIADSANATLEAFGFPTLHLSTYRDYLGDGARGLAKKSLPQAESSEEMIDKFVERYRAEYFARWDAHTVPFLGIPELLDELTRRDIPMAVLSNKRDDFTNRCVSKLLGNWHFAIVRGERDGVPLKPDPKGLKDVCFDLGVKPSDCLYVGDSEIDIEVARMAETQCVSVTWGFRDASILRDAGAAELIDNPMDLIEFIT